MTGLALWHFTVFLPDRFWGGIVGAFLGALAGAIIFGLIINAGSIPGQDDTTCCRASRRSRARSPAWRVVWFVGVRNEQAEPHECGGRASSRRSRRRSTPSGAPDLDAFAAHLAWLRESRLDGVFVAGTTGEGVLLEDDEVAALVERAVAPRTGCGSSPRSGGRARARPCGWRGGRSSSGADAVAAYVPWFYPATEGDVRGHFLALLEAAEGHAGVPLQHPAPHGERPLARAARRARARRATPG